MTPYRSTASPSTWVLVLIVLLLTTATTFAGNIDQRSQHAAQILRFHPDDSHTRAGFDAFYNADYDRSIREFEIAVKEHPNDAFAVNHLLTAVMFKEMYRIGALDSDLYAKDSFLHSKQFPVDPKVTARVNELAARSLAISEAQLKANPNDVNALYTRGVIRGLRAAYTALVEKAWFAALRSAVGARHDQERVLELDPNYTDAKMTVGIHNYVLGSISWPVKVAASIVGLSGSRTKGIQYLYDAANGGGEASVDSKIALALFLRREQRYPEAIKLVQGLTDSYPGNFLMALELANLYNAAGKGTDAIATYRKIIGNAQSGAYQDAHIEMAWYGLGEALRGQKQFADAAHAYDKVLEFQRADPDLRLRTQLGAGEMYDALSKRQEAVKRYEQVIASDASSPRADLARQHLKDPYRPM